MRCWGLTDKGLVRKMNQDNYVITYSESGDLFAIVCDGIGGGKGGEVASKMAIDYLSEQFSATTGFRDLEEARNWIRYHIRTVNRMILEKGNNNVLFKGMGTTLVGVFVSKIGNLVINIGDSRCYGVFHDNAFHLLTQDHTLVNEMLRHHEITEEQAKNHPKKHVLVNALGVWDEIRIDIDKIEGEYQRFLLCSDGLYGYVEESQIYYILMSDLSSAIKVRRLMNLALKAGGFDNITIILVEGQKGDY